MPRLRLSHALLPVCLAAASACGRGGDETSAGPAGVPLPEPRLMPAVALTTTEGEQFQLRRETAGTVTLLFFGYTHCPDVCPIHFANLAATLHRLPVRLAREVQVVFVTTDPERDTPERLRAWLDGFDPGFIGLTGHPDTLARLQERLGLAPAVREPRPDGSYLVGHAAQVLAFGRDQVARVAFPFGVRQADWAVALPRLIEGHAAPPPAGPIRITRATARPLAQGAGAAIYFTATNAGAAPDTLVAVDASPGPSAALADTGDTPLVVPAGGRIALVPDGAGHVLVEGAWHPIRVGDTLSLELRWARNGRTVARVPVEPPGGVGTR